MNFRKEMHEEAVSPVIGVILMVAITVVLAATIAMFAFSSTDKIETTRIVSLQSSVVGDNVTVTLEGGADLSELQSLKFTWDGSALSGGIWVNNVDKSSSISAGKYENSDGFEVGDIFTLTNKGGNLKVIGKFVDGGEQILFDKTYKK